MILLTIKYGVKGTTKLEQTEETFKTKQRILSLGYMNSIYTKWVNQMPQPWEHPGLLCFTFTSANSPSKSTQSPVFPST